MSEMIIMFFAGLLLVMLGLRIWKKQQINLIHSYHYKNVSTENKGIYTKNIGIGLIIAGTSTSITGLVEYITKSPLSWLIFAVSFGIGMAIMIRAQFKYNGSLF